MTHVCNIIAILHFLFHYIQHRKGLQNLDTTFGEVVVSVVNELQLWGTFTDECNFTEMCTMV